MTVLEIISKALPAIAGLDSWLREKAAQYPDLAPEIEAKLAILGSTTTPEALSALGSSAISELADFAQRGITDPKFNPSNLAG